MPRDLVHLVQLAQVVRVDPPRPRLDRVPLAVRRALQGVLGQEVHLLELEQRARRHDGHVPSDRVLDEQIRHHPLPAPPPPIALALFPVRPPPHA